MTFLTERHCFCLDFIPYIVINDSLSVLCAFRHIIRFPSWQLCLHSALCRLESRTLVSVSVSVYIIYIHFITLFLLHGGFLVPMPYPHMLYRSVIRASRPSSFVVGMRHQHQVFLVSHSTSIKFFSYIFIRNKYLFDIYLLYIECAYYLCHAVWLLWIDYFIMSLFS